MKQMGKRISALLLTMAILVGLCVIPAAAEDSSESGNWYDAAMTTWAGRGVIKGDADGSLNPTANITRAELAVMLDRIMRYRVIADNTFTDVAENQWYTEAVLNASAAGILKGDGAAANPGVGITRQEVMVMLARVLCLSGGSGAAAGFTDESEIAPWALDAVKSMAAKGYVKGSEGRLTPTANITRAEVVTMLDNIFKGYFDEAGTYDTAVSGDAVINTGDVTLSGMEITGDLILAEGVGDGHIVLDGVTLGGRLIIRGGGENSVIIKGNSKIGEVAVARQDGKVRVSVEDSAAVAAVLVSGGADALKLEGKVDTITIAAAGAAVEITGTVKSVEIAEAAEGASLTVAKGAKADTVTVAAPKSGLNVAGTVTRADVTGTAGGVTVTTEKGAKVSSIVTNAAGTVVKGESGTVAKVEAGKDATGTTVNTGGTRVQNNSAEAVISGTGTIAPGKTGTSNGEGSKPTTGGSTSGGGYVTPPDELMLRYVEEHLDSVNSELTVNGRAFAALELDATNRKEVTVHIYDGSVKNTNGEISRALTQVFTLLNEYSGITGYIVRDDAAAAAKTTQFLDKTDADAVTDVKVATAVLRAMGIGDVESVKLIAGGTLADFIKLMAAQSCNELKVDALNGTASDVVTTFHFTFVDDRGQSALDYISSNLSAVNDTLKYGDGSFANLSIGETDAAAKKTQVSIHITDGAAPNTSVTAALNSVIDLVKNYGGITGYQIHAVVTGGTDKTFADKNTALSGEVAIAVCQAMKLDSSVMAKGTMASFIAGMGEKNQVEVIAIDSAGQEFYTFHFTFIDQRGKDLQAYVTDHLSSVNDKMSDYAALSVSEYTDSAAKVDVAIFNGDKENTSVAAPVNAVIELVKEYPGISKYAVRNGDKSRTETFGKEDATSGAVAIAVMRALEITGMQSADMSAFVEAMNKSGVHDVYVDAVDSADEVFFTFHFVFPDVITSSN